MQQRHDLDLDRCAHAVIEAAIEVHKHLGPGFSKSTYEHALMIELGLRGLSVEHQVPIQVAYKGHDVSETKLDLLVAKHLVVEIKAGDALYPLHGAQLVSYLRAGAFPLGLLINFNVPILGEGARRVVAPQ